MRHPDARRRAAADGPRPAARTHAGRRGGATTRTTLRLPDHLKTQVEAAAARDGVSVNTWLVRAVAAALEQSTGRPAAAGPSAAARRRPRHRLGALTRLAITRRHHVSAARPRPLPDTTLTPPMEPVMPTFPAPQPVPVVVDVPFANLHVVAGDRDDVVVTVLPADPSKSGCVRAAEETRVDRDGDAVTISYPVSWKQYVLPFASGTADITVELPTGSALQRQGRLAVRRGPARRRRPRASSAGDVRIDDASPPRPQGLRRVRRRRPRHRTRDLKVSAGGVRDPEFAGDGTDPRQQRHRRPSGPSPGPWTCAGRTPTSRWAASTAPHRQVGARRHPRRPRSSPGSVTLTTSFGSIEVGVPEGTAAWLDVASEHGTVRNHLTPTEGPVENEATAEIHASTGFGDVVVRRP